MDAAANGYKNIIRRVAEILADPAPAERDDAMFSQWHDKILASVSDNMKTATALVYVQDLLKETNITASTKIALLEFIDRLLGLQFIAKAQN